MYVLVFNLFLMCLLRYIEQNFYQTSSESQLSTMPLDLSDLLNSPSSSVDADDSDADEDDVDDVVVTIPTTKPAAQNWKRSPRHSSGSDIHPIVVVPSDSEDDSDDDIAIVSVCPPPPEDNDDCIVESYEPASKPFCSVSPDSMLAVSPAPHDDPVVDVSCANDSLDLQFAAYSQSTDQTDTFLVHDVPNLSAWLLSSESASSVKQPVMNSVQNTCPGDSPVLACSSTFGVPLSIPSADKAQFNTVQLQTGGILFDVGAAKVSASIDKTSVLSLSAKIQSSDDRHSTTVSFVGSISDQKSPANADFVSVQTDVSRPSDDINLSLVTVSPVASPDVASTDRVNSCCQTASVALNVNATVDAALNDTVDGLLRQMSYQKNLAKSDVVPSTINIKNEHETKDVNTVDDKAVARRCIPLVESHSSSISHSCSRVPASSESYALLKKRKSQTSMSSSSVKTPRLPVPLADLTRTVSNVARIQPCPLQDCCCCQSVMAAENLSHCLVGHPCCGICLQKHVKSILTSSVKVSNFCNLCLISCFCIASKDSHGIFGICC